MYYYNYYHYYHIYFFYTYVTLLGAISLTLCVFGDIHISDLTLGLAERGQEEEEENEQH